MTSYSSTDLSLPEVAMDNGEPLQFLESEGCEPDTATDSSSPGESSGDFVIDDSDRYSRLRLIPWWRQELLAKAKVLVVGAGALGNEVLKNLALIGVGTVYVIDRDAIETSNLSRSVLFRLSDGGRPKAEVAALRTKEINPEIEIHWMKGDVICDVGLSLFKDVDVVIGCLDNREARLWVNRQCWKATTPWVDSGIQEIQGVVKVFVPPDSACYECAMTERDYQLLNIRYSCPLLSREQMLEGKVPTAPTIASMMGALEVQEALKLLHGMPVAAGSALVFNGVTNQFYSTKLPHKADCLSHETYPEATPLRIDHDATVEELFELASTVLEGPFVLPLERDVVLSVNCPVCGWSVDLHRPRTQVSTTTATCPTCDRLGQPNVVSAVGSGDGLVKLPLSKLGIPAGDILRVDGSMSSSFFRLSDHGAKGWHKVS
jgi:adenylyltransferase/sulfurtransferase